MFLLMTNSKDPMLLRDITTIPFRQNYRKNCKIFQSYGTRYLRSLRPIVHDFVRYVKDKNYHKISTLYSRNAVKVKCKLQDTTYILPSTKHHKQSKYPLWGQDWTICLNICSSRSDDTFWVFNSMTVSLWW